MRRISVSVLILLTGACLLLAHGMSASMPDQPRANGSLIVLAEATTPQRLPQKNQKNPNQRNLYQGHTTSQKVKKAHASVPLTLKEIRRAPGLADHLGHATSRTMQLAETTFMRR
jgi:DNA-binding response OmpR family regulator